MASPPNSRRADEAASGRPGPAYSLLTDRDRLIVQRRRPWPFDGHRPLILDRAPRQTAWSNALVRHWTDARTALSAVLGIAANGILGRESAGPAASSYGQYGPQPAPHQ
jgi:hypothetical protein